MRGGLVPAGVGWSFTSIPYEYANSGFIDSLLSSRRQSGLHLGPVNVTISRTVYSYGPFTKEVNSRLANRGLTSLVLNKRGQKLRSGNWS